MAEKEQINQILCVFQQVLLGQHLHHHAQPPKQVKPLPNQQSSYSAQNPKNLNTTASVPDFFPQVHKSVINLPQHQSVCYTVTGVKETSDSYC